VDRCPIIYSLRDKVQNRTNTPEELMVLFREPLGKPDFETNYYSPLLLWQF